MTSAYSRAGQKSVVLGPHAGDNARMENASSALERRTLAPTVQLPQNHAGGTVAGHQRRLIL
jgi:hypothetical protein